MSNMYFMPFRPAYDSAGISVPGSKHYFTLSGGETPSAPFQNAILSIPHSNPVIADGVGKIPAIYLDEAIEYRVRIYDRNADVGVDTPLEDYDPYIPGTLGILPPDADRPGRYFAFDADGNPVASDGTGADIGLRTDLAASTGTSLLAWMPTPGGISAIDLQTALSLALPMKPEFFGAVGDGVTDDHAAFRAMTARGVTLGYLHIELRHGAIYRVGKQNANSLDSLGFGPYYRANENPIEALNLSSLIVRGNGAKFKFNDGLLYGGFNTTTGLPEDSTGPSHNAHPGYIVRSSNTPFVRVGGFEVEGNSQNMVLGGACPSVGFFEARHGGVLIDGAEDCKLSDMEIYNVLLDGWIVTQSSSGGLTTSSDRLPCIIENVRVHDFGRSGFSILGGNQVLLVNSSSVRAAAAPVTGGGVRGTAPACAMDIESEAGVIRNVTVINCNFEQGAHGSYCVTFDSGDTKEISFYDSRLVGTQWVDKEGAKFYNCDIYGCFVRATGNYTNPADNPVFNDCFITDATVNDTPLQTQSGLLFGNSTPQMTGTAFNRCTFDLARLKFNAPDTITRHCTWILRYDTTVFAAGTAVVLLTTSGTHENPTFIETIAANFPSPAFQISVTGTATVRRGSLTSASSYLVWMPTGVTTGFTGDFDNSPRTPFALNAGSPAAITPTHPQDQINLTALVNAVTINNPSGYPAGYAFRLRMKDNGTSRALTWGTQYRAFGTALPAATTVGKTTYVFCVWNATDTKADVVDIKTET